MYSDNYNKYLLWGFWVGGIIDMSRCRNVQIIISAYTGLGILHSCNNLSQIICTRHMMLFPVRAYHWIASYPGPSQKKGEGLVHTVCACAKIPRVFMGVRITPYLTVDYIRGLFVIVRFIAWVWLYGYGQSLRLFYRCRLRSF